MPISFYIFLIASFIALIPAWFDHGETLEKIKSGTENKKRRNIIKLLALWAIPILTIIGTIYLGIESVISDKQEQKIEREYRAVTNSLASVSIQLNAATHQITVQSNALAEAKIKPYKTRLIDCLNSINPKIIATLQGQHQISRFEITIIPSYLLNELQKLASEPEGSKYIRVEVGITEGEVQSWSMGMGPGGQTQDATLFINPSLLK